MHKYQYILHREPDKNRMVEDMQSRELEYPIVVEVKDYTNRSLPQNALFHVWCRQAAEFLKLKGYTDSKGVTCPPEEQMKLVFKHLFLEVRDHVLSERLTVKGQIPSTSKLPKAEMHHFMSQVEAWCTEKGIPIRIEGQYKELRDTQNK